jgi:3-hydroxybutyryl-CoA dehydratase
MTAQRYAESLQRGETIASRPIVMDANAFRMFSALTGDRHPIHDDAQYARAHGFRAPVAHGLLVLAMTALGATDFSEAVHASMIALVSASADFLAPVFEGDIVVATLTVADVAHKSGNRSLVAVDVELKNAQDTIVARARHRYLLKTKADV